MDGDESRPFTTEPSGPANVETYTVVFGREGEPEQGIVIGRLGDRTRFFANTPADRELLSSMTSEEFIGVRAAYLMTRRRSATCSRSENSIVVRRSGLPVAVSRRGCLHRRYTVGAIQEG